MQKVKEARLSPEVKGEPLRVVSKRVTDLNLGFRQVVLSVVL